MLEASGTEALKTKRLATSKLIIYPDCSLITAYTISPASKTHTFTPATPLVAMTSGNISYTATDNMHSKYNTGNADYCGGWTVVKSGALASWVTITDGTKTKSVGSFKIDVPKTAVKSSTN